MKSKVILLFLLIGIGVGGWTFYNKEINTTTVVRTYYGNVDTRTVTLGFRFLGQINQITKDEGEPVKAGELLAVLDSSDLKKTLETTQANIKAAQAQLKKLESGFRPEEIAEAKATVNEAQANVNKAQDNYQRQSLLHKTHTTPEATYVQAKLSYRQAQAALEKANAAYTLTTQGYRSEDIETQKATLQALQAQAQKLQIDINDTVLYAPVDGVILTRYKEPGSITSPGSSILEMAKTDEFWVRAYVDEQYLGDIQPNQTMLITTDSRKEPYEGRVGFISPVAEFTPKTIETEALRSDLVYRFRVIVANPDNHIRQGMPVTLRVQ